MRHDGNERFIYRARFQFPNYADFEFLCTFCCLTQRTQLKKRAKLKRDGKVLLGFSNASCFRKEANVPLLFIWIYIYVYLYLVKMRQQQQTGVYDGNEWFLYRAGFQFPNYSDFEFLCAVCRLTQRTQHKKRAKLKRDGKVLLGFSNASCFRKEANVPPFRLYISLCLSISSEDEEQQLQQTGLPTFLLPLPLIHSLLPASTMRTTLK